MNQHAVFFVCGSETTYPAFVREFRVDVDKIFGKDCWYPQWATVSGLSPRCYVVIGIIGRRVALGAVQNWDASLVKEVQAVLDRVKELGCVVLNL